MVSCLPPVLSSRPCSSLSSCPHYTWRSRLVTRIPESSTWYLFLWSSTSFQLWPSRPATTTTAPVATSPIATSTMLPTTCCPLPSCGQFLSVDGTSFQFVTSPDGAVCSAFSVFYSCYPACGHGSIEHPSFNLCLSFQLQRARHVRGDRGYFVSVRFETHNGYREGLWRRKVAQCPLLRESRIASYHSPVGFG